ncbi:MAG: hypothetical protein WAV27_24300 [Xanthobacteraceae bacterium]
MDLDVVLFDNDSGPNASHQLVFADDFAARIRKHTKNIESPAAERHRDPVAGQLPLPRIQPKPAEADLIPIHRP